MYAGPLETTHVRTKVLTNHLVQACISQMRELGRRGLICPRSHGPSAAELQLGFHVGSQALRSRRLPGPPFAGPKGAGELGRKGPRAGSLLTVGRPAPGPGPGWHGAPTSTAAPPGPPSSRTARAVATPLPGQGFGRLDAPGTGCGARHAGLKAAGVTLKWAPSWAAGPPRRPGVPETRTQCRR